MSNDMTTTQRKQAINKIEYHPKIQDLPAEKRAGRRWRDRGTAAASKMELLAILLRSGTTPGNPLELATRLLSQHQRLDGPPRAGFRKLADEYGTSEAKAALLQVAIELDRRLLTAAGRQRASARSLRNVADPLMAEMAVLDHEHLRVAMRQNWPAVIVVQHHPPGDPTASDDAMVTRELVGTGKALGIDVLAHVAMGRHTFGNLK